MVVPEETYTRGVAYLDGNFSSGVDGGAGRSDQGFLTDELSVGEDGNPAVFTGADHQRHWSGGLCVGLLRRSVDSSVAGIVVCRE